MTKKLVSLITPCYNTGRYINRLLDSVLSQTYPSIEMIVVDDGSEDNSKAIIESYIKRFAARGYTLKYIYQKNSGQSSALKNGLNYVHGEYISWPDSDDYYATENAIDTFVMNLESSSDIGAVRCMQRIVDENTLQEIYVDGINVTKETANLFEDCLFFKNNFYIQPISFMINFSALSETTELDKIYTCQLGGQNWQLLLPVLYVYKCLTIGSVLTNILQRSESHSREKLSYDKFIERTSCFETVAIETLKRIKQMSQKNAYQYISQIQYNAIREKMSIAYRNRKRTDYMEFYQKWSEITNDSKLFGNRLTMLAVKLHIESFWDFCRNIYGML